MTSESKSSQNTWSFSLIGWLPLTSPWINLDSENCEYLCESRCLKLKEMCTPSCNIFSTLVQLDETPAQAASETNSRLKLDKRRRGQSKNRLTFFFFFLIQAELFLSHFFIHRLTSHYLKPLFLPVLAAGPLASCAAYRPRFIFASAQALQHFSLSFYEVSWSFTVFLLQLASL